MTHTPWRVQPWTYNDIFATTVMGQTSRFAARNSEDWYGIDKNDGVSELHALVSDKDFAQLFAAAPETAAELERVKALNAELVAIIESGLRAAGKLEHAADVITIHDWSVAARNVLAKRA